MNDQLVPEYLSVPCGVKEICGLKDTNQFLFVNLQNEFAVATLDNTIKLKTEVIQQNYPNSELDGAEFQGLFASPNGNVIWTIQTRAIIGLDRVNQKPFDKLFASGGNTSLIKTVVGDSDEIIMGQVFDATGDNGEYKCWFANYNFRTDFLGAPSKYYKGFMFHLGGDRFLWCETLGSMYKVKWHICNSTFSDIQHNKLTEELTKRQITMWGRLTPISTIKRMMIGAITVGYDMNYFSIRWNHDMSEVKIEPIVLQIPPNGSMANPWFFSEDGSWLVATNITYLPEEKKTLLFYHIDDKYPQGISLSVFGQETQYEKDGCFLNHSVHGPLYLDWSPEFANTLLVYRLNDVLKVLAGKVGVRG